MMQASYQTYDSYKGSGVPWLGEIPKDWDVLPGLACIEESKEKNTGMKEKIVLSLSYGRVIVKSKDKLTGLVPESFETYQIVKPGDIIIRGTDLQNDVTSLRTGLAKDHGIITSAYLNLRPKKHVNPEYLHYLLHSYDLLKVFYGMGSGLRQNLDYRDFKRLDIAIPSSDEQDRIVAFLDQKTAEIDAAIEKKQRLIELLKEQKSILINQAVTKGLNASAPMKDSGIEWIGHIPAHWEVKRVKHASKKITKGTTPSTEGAGFADEGIRYLKAENIVDNQISLEPAYFISEKTDQLISRSRLQKDDVLFVIAGATIGKTAVLDEEIVPANTNQAVSLIRPSGIILPHFLHLWLQSDYLANVIKVDAVQSAQPNISMEDLGNAFMPLPDKTEQNEIVSFSNKISYDFLKAIECETSGIEKLQEFKQTLIAHAVTGKIKV